MGLCHRTSLTSSSGLRTLSIRSASSSSPLYTVVDCRRPSVSGCCCLCLERTATPRHVFSVAASFLAVVSRLVFSAVHFVTFCCSCQATCIIVGHFNRFCYSLSYLKQAHMCVFAKITREECLLPVASWPSLGDLVIHGNPLASSTRSDLPVLTQTLRQKLGIQVDRFIIIVIIIFLTWPK